MDFLSRPPVAKQGIKQVICHGHKVAVIFAGYSWDNSNLVTVDSVGPDFAVVVQPGQEVRIRLVRPRRDLGHELEPVIRPLCQGAAWRWRRQAWRGPHGGEGGGPRSRRRDEEHEEWVTSYRVVRQQEERRYRPAGRARVQGSRKGAGGTWLSVLCRPRLRGRRLVQRQPLVPFRVCSSVLHLPEPRAGSGHEEQGAGGGGGAGGPTATLFRLPGLPEDGKLEGSQDGRRLPRGRESAGPACEQTVPVLGTRYLCRSPGRDVGSLLVRHRCHGKGHRA